MSSSPKSLRMSKIPCFALPLSTDGEVEPWPCFFYTLAEQKTTAHEFHLPQIANHRPLGSSANGFLIFLDDATANLCVISHLTKACIPLPPTSTFSDIAGVNRDPISGQIASYVMGPSKFRDILSITWDPTSAEYCCKAGKAPADFTRAIDVGDMRRTYFKKAIAIPSADAVTVVAIHKDRERLAFANPGDTSWTAVHCPADHHYEDILYHKGRLHAVSNGWTLDVFDIGNPSDGPVVYDHRADLQWIGDECEELDKALRWCLAESPDGEELFLAAWKIGWDDSVGFDVFKLDESGGCKWVEVRSLDGLAMFVGANSVTMVPEPGDPVIVGDCIYFLERSEGGVGVGAFDLADQSTRRLNLDIELQKLNTWAWSAGFARSVV